MNNKSSCCSNFVTRKDLVEKQTSKQLKALGYDNGGEFFSTQFKESCKREGIHRRYTTPYTPQQNGFMERRNRIVVEMANCIVHSQNVPQPYWETTVNAIYILNKTPCKYLQDITPKDSWLGRKPFVRDFRIFSCIAFANIPKEKRS